MIDCIKVEVRPERGEENGAAESLVIKVWSNGELYEQRLPMSENELISLFDQVWDVAKQQMLEELEKQYKET